MMAHKLENRQRCTEAATELSHCGSTTLSFLCKYISSVFSEGQGCIFAGRVGEECTQTVHDLFLHCGFILFWQPGPRFSDGLLSPQILLVTSLSENSVMKACLSVHQCQGRFERKEEKNIKRAKSHHVHRCGTFSYRILLQFSLKSNWVLLHLRFVLVVLASIALIITSRFIKLTTKIQGSSDISERNSDKARTTSGRQVDNPQTKEKLSQTINTQTVYRTTSVSTLTDFTYLSVRLSSQISKQP